MNYINYSNQLSDNIIKLRKKEGITQEELATYLNVSYQAVSKWENKQSSPDITLLPLLAQRFHVTIDVLFGVEPQQEVTIKQPMPWEDDNTLYVVAYQGHTLLKQAPEHISFEYKGDVLNIQSQVNVTCNNVQGNATAGADIDCDNIGNDGKAGCDINCDNIGNDAKAGCDITCVNVQGSARAGCDIRVKGNVGSIG